LYEKSTVHNISFITERLSNIYNLIFEALLVYTSKSKHNKPYLKSRTAVQSTDLQLPASCLWLWLRTVRYQ